MNARMSVNYRLELDLVRIMKVVHLRHALGGAEP